MVVPAYIPSRAATCTSVLVPELKVTLTRVQSWVPMSPSEYVKDPVGPPISSRIERLAPTLTDSSVSTTFFVLIQPLRR